MHAAPGITRALNLPDVRLPDGKRPCITLKEESQRDNVNSFAQQRVRGLATSDELRTLLPSVGATEPALYRRPSKPVSLCPSQKGQHRKDKENDEQDFRNARCTGSNAAEP